MSDSLSVLISALGTPQRPNNPVDKNGNVYFHCPFCDHKNKKLTVNIEKGLWNCWVCETRGRSLSRLMIKTGNQAQAELLNTYIKPQLDIDNLFGQNDVKKVKQVVVLPKGFVPIFKNINKVFFQAALYYLYKRGFVKEDILKYDIHYSITEQRVLFPSYDDNETLNYYVSRSIRPDEKMKYKNATVPKRDVIFNEHLVEWNKELYLVEGIFDAIISRKNAVPILGSSINDEFRLFRKIIKNKTPIVIALDADARKKALTMANKFIIFGIEVRFIDWKEGEERDIAAMGSEEFMKIATSGALRNVEFKDTIKEKLFR